MKRRKKKMLRILNEDLFKDEGNLDDLDNIIDDEEDVKDGEKKP